jgi:hypothetical protein
MKLLENWRDIFRAYADDKLIQFKHMDSNVFATYKESTIDISIAQLDFNFHVFK